MKILTQLQLAWRILTNQPERFALSMLGIGFSVVIVFMQLGFFYGLNDAQANLPPYMTGDLVLSSPKKNDLKSYKKIYGKMAHQVTNLPEVEAVSDFYFRANLWVNPDTQRASRALFIGVDLDNPMFAIPEIAKYREALRRPNTMLFDKASHSELGEIEIGDVIRVGDLGQPFEVVGLFSLGANFSYEGNVIVSPENWVAVNGSQRYGRNEEWVDLVYVKITEGANPQAVRNKIQEQVSGYFDIHTPRELFAREVRATTRETPSGFILGIGLIVGIVIGVIFCYQVLFNEITDNISQFATMKAIGHPPGFLTGVVLSCAVILGCGGFILGFLASLGVYDVIESLTQIAFNLTPFRVIAVFALSSIMCLISGFLAMQRVLKTDPAELF